MRNIAVTMMMSLLMITTALAGCMGDDEEKSETIVGDWYAGEEKIVTFNSDGTALGDGDEVVNWSIDGNILTIVENDGDADPMYFHLSDGWLFITEEVGSDCVAFSNEIIGGEDAFISATENLTLPSLCGSLDYGLSNSNPEMYQYSATDHSDVVTNFTNDTLIVLQMAYATNNLSWANVHIQFIGEDGVPITCEIDAGDGNCEIIQYGSDNLTWEKSEILHVTENGANMCEAVPCILTVKITDVRSGVQLTGSSDVVVD